MIAISLPCGGVLCCSTHSSLLFASVSQESVVSGEKPSVRGNSWVVSGVCGVYVGNESILMAHLTRAHRNGSDGVEDCGGDTDETWDG